MLNMDINHLINIVNYSSWFTDPCIQGRVETGSPGDLIIRGPGLDLVKTIFKNLQNNIVIMKYCNSNL